MTMLYQITGLLSRDREAEDAVDDGESVNTSEDKRIQNDQKIVVQEKSSQDLINPLKNSLPEKVGMRTKAQSTTLQPPPLLHTQQSGLFSYLGNSTSMDCRRQTTAHNSAISRPKSLDISTVADL